MGAQVVRAPAGAEHLFGRICREASLYTMFRKATCSLRAVSARALLSQQRGYKCSVLGAAGGIGQPLSLLLKLNPRVTSLTCYDVAPITPGVAADLSHINTKATCAGFTGDELTKALDGCDIVVIPAGVPRKPGMTRDDLFNINAGIVKTLVNG